MLKLSVLGSTGSIGKSTLDVVRLNPESLKVVGLAAGANLEELASQVAEFKPLAVSVANSSLIVPLRNLLSLRLAEPSKVEIFAEGSGAEQIAALAEADVVVGAMSGFVGLKPIVAAIKQGKHIALANKETLVAAGQFVRKLAAEHRVRILPVDSEHSSLFQCLQGQEQRGEAISLILTASGGPFLNQRISELSQVTPDEAIAHPRWKMGPKISVDSATLINKALEVIEAESLFALPSSKIRVLIHPQSIVHGLVEFADGTLLAALFNADMKAPITYALNYLMEGVCQTANRCQRISSLVSGVKRLSLTQCGDLSFKEVDSECFPALGLAYAALEKGGAYPAILNASNEVAVNRFMRRDILFTQIVRVVSEVMDMYNASPVNTLDDIYLADAWARDVASKLEVKNF